MGGGAIAEFARQNEHWLMEGIGLTLVCAGLGAVAKATGEEDEANGTPASKGEKARKQRDCGNPGAK